MQIHAPRIDYQQRPEHEAVNRRAYIGGRARREGSAGSFGYRPSKQLVGASDRVGELPHRNQLRAAITRIAFRNGAS